MAERLALPTSNHGVAVSNPPGGEILPEPKWGFIAQSLSCSTFHRLEMTEILLKGCKTPNHPSINDYLLSNMYSVRIAIQNPRLTPTLILLIKRNNFKIKISFPLLFSIYIFEYCLHLSGHFWSELCRLSSVHKKAEFAKVSEGSADRIW